MNRLLCCLASIVWMLVSWVSFALGQTALPNAHAHNDYAHQHPLFDALAHGFTSIEADVHLINNELYVAHDAPKSLKGVKTLKALYLEPLHKYILQHKGLVYAGYAQPVYLMIDVKTDAEATYQALIPQLNQYASILQTRDNPLGPVRVVLSGNRAITLALADPNYTVGVDGRPEDLPRYFDSQLMPIISQHYGQVIRWNGEGEIPADEFAKLQKMADAAHQQEKKLRLWASPEKQNVWEVLRKAGVDFINTDQLDALQKFLTQTGSR